ncbi:MAG: type II toxin-antitoxin system PemK/MazF family toxin [Chloroflexi bacterium]|nr:type II toxin-antitoxin system PemK/MazF family toxin [Chloroflexota bacterium]
MRRGDIVLVDFSGGVGGEIQKTRPAIVVTDDRYLARENRLQVVPLTSNLRRLYVTEARVVVNGRASKAMANQLRTVALQRVKATLGRAPPLEMRFVEAAIATQLALRLALRPLPPTR